MEGVAGVVNTLVGHGMVTASSVQPPLANNTQVLRLLTNHKLPPLPWAWLSSSSATIGNKTDTTRMLARGLFKYFLTPPLTFFKRRWLKYMSRVCSTRTQRPKISTKLLILSPHTNVCLDALNFLMCSGCHQPELRPGTSDQGAVDTRHHMEPPIIRCLVLTIICEACSVMVQWCNVTLMECEEKNSEEVTPHVSAVLSSSVLQQRTMWWYYVH